MCRLLNCIVIIAPLILTTQISAAEQMTAEKIFDRMIHYEYDQLSKVPSITDYTCKVTETTIRPGNTKKEVTNKVLYFMIPMFQLQTINDEPAFYFDQDLMLMRLDSLSLKREKDAKINDVDCYVITTRQRDPAYKAYYITYYIAKDDFRRVRTISHHASDEMDNLTTTIEYTYGPVDKFTLLISTYAETKDKNDKLIAITNAEYKDYKFGIGLDVKFFSEHVGNRKLRRP